MENVQVITPFRSELINGDLSTFSIAVSGVNSGDVLELHITAANSETIIQRVSSANEEGHYLFTKSLRFLNNVLYDGAKKITRELANDTKYVFNYRIINITNGGEFKGFSQFITKAPLDEDGIHEPVSFKTFDKITSDMFNLRISDFFKRKVVNEMTYDFIVVGSSTYFKVNSGVVVDHRGIRYDLAYISDSELLLPVDVNYCRISIEYKKTSNAKNTSAALKSFAISDLTDVSGTDSDKDEYCEIFILQKVQGVWEVLTKMSSHVELSNEHLNLLNTLPQEIKGINNDINEMILSISRIEGNVDSIGISINQINTAISNIIENYVTATELSVIENNITILQEAVRDLTINYVTNTELTVIENNITALQQAVENLTNADLAEHTHPISQVVDLQTELDKKADKITLDAELDKKADKTTLDTELDKKADKITLDAELDKKADKITLDAELDKKADKTTLDTELDKKVDKTTLDTELDKKADVTQLLPRHTQKRRKSKDANDIFTIVEEYLPDGTLYSRSTLSGGTSPLYTTRTVQYFDIDGVTVLETIQSTLTYDAQNDIISDIT